MKSCNNVRKYTIRFCIRWASTLAVSLCISSGSAQTVHISHCLAGCPRDLGAGLTGEDSRYDEIVVRHLYVAAINKQNGQSDWVAYRLLADSVGVASLLPRLWVVDELVQNKRILEQADSIQSELIRTESISDEARVYRINEVQIDSDDQGRLAPMSGFAGTPYWRELNYLSNMSQLPPGLRMGSWSRLDQSINEFAARVGEVFVISGPLYQDQLPTAYFKVIATKERQAAFIFPRNLDQHRRYCDQLSSLQRVQELANLELFPNLESTQAADLESEFGCAD